MDGLEDRIKQRAYEIWVSEGRPEGRSEAHWEQARRELSDGMASGEAHEIGIDLGKTGPATGTAGAGDEEAVTSLTPKKRSSRSSAAKASL